MHAILPEAAYLLPSSIKPTQLISAPQVRGCIPFATTLTDNLILLVVYVAYFHCRPISLGWHREIPQKKARTRHNKERWMPNHLAMYIARWWKHITVSTFQSNAASLQRPGASIIVSTRSGWAERTFSKVTASVRMFESCFVHRHLVGNGLPGEGQLWPGNYERPRKNFSQVLWEDKNARDRLSHRLCRQVGSAHSALMITCGLPVSSRTGYLSNVWGNCHHDRTP